MLAALSSVFMAAPPHLVVILADDLGWYDTSIRNPNAPTPAIANLSASGLVLERHYVFRFCSPSRRSLLSGRLPTSITTVQPDGDKLCSDFLPLATTTIAQKLSSVGYACHFVGKGHLGYQTIDHMPVNRGFATHIGYLDGAENYHRGCATTACSADPTVGRHDLWEGDAPATTAVPKMVYSADIYTARAVELVEAHPVATPFFLYFAIQNVHSPYQLPPALQVKSYPAMGSKWHVYANMLYTLDEGVHNLTAALRRHAMWEDTLMLFTADNGGTLAFGNNYPLHGHKHDPWEGGTRATAFLAGGFVPDALRGRRSDALVHISDWYPTFATLAGASPVDTPVIDGKPRPIDGVNVWPLLTGATLSQPRAITVVTEVSAIEVAQGTAGGWRGGGGDGPRLWKLIVLAGQSNTNTMAGEQLNGTRPCLGGRQPDPPQPGRTDPIVNGPAYDEHSHACAVCNATVPCLFDVLSDPGETTNVAAQHRDVVARLSAAIAAANAAVYTNGTLDDEALAAYERVAPSQHWGGFLGPCYVKTPSTRESPVHDHGADHGARLGCLKCCAEPEADGTCCCLVEGCPPLPPSCPAPSAAG